MVRRVIGLALGVCMAACSVATESGPEGSGTVVGDVREVGAFDRIAADDGVSVILRIDPVESESLVVVHYDDNLLEHVVTTMEDGTLLVSIDGPIRLPGNGRFVSIRLPALSAVDASGGASVVGQGDATDASVTASGGASVDLHAVPLVSLEVQASGGASVVVFASDSARITADGGASVTLYGSPPDLSIEESGGGSVTVSPGSPDDPAT